MRSASAYVRSLRVSGGVTQHEVVQAVKRRKVALTQTLLSEIENSEKEATPEVVNAISAAILEIVERRRVHVGQLVNRSEEVVTPA